MRGRSGTAARARAVVKAIALLGVSFGIVAQQGARAPLSITGITPSGTNVPAARQIVIQFNRAVVPIGRMERTAAEIPIEITPALKCQWRWLDTSALACCGVHATRQRVVGARASLRRRALRRRSRAARWRHARALERRFVLGEITLAHAPRARATRSHALHRGAVYAASRAARHGKWRNYAAFRGWHVCCLACHERVTLRA